MITHCYFQAGEKVEYLDSQKATVDLLKQNLTAIKILKSSGLIKDREMSRIDKRLKEFAELYQLKIQKICENEYKILIGS